MLPSASCTFMLAGTLTHTSVCPHSALLPLAGDLRRIAPRALSLARPHSARSGESARPHGSGPCGSSDFHRECYASPATCLASHSGRSPWPDRIQRARASQRALTGLGHADRATFIANARLEDPTVVRERAARASYSPRQNKKISLHFRDFAVCGFFGVAVHHERTPPARRNGLPARPGSVPCNTRANISFGPGLSQLALAADLFILARAVLTARSHGAVPVLKRPRTHS